MSGMTIRKASMDDLDRVTELEALVHYYAKLASRTKVSPVPSTAAQSGTRCG